MSAPLTEAARAQFETLMRDATEFYRRLDAQPPTPKSDALLLRLLTLRARLFTYQLELDGGRRVSRPPRSVSADAQKLSGELQRIVSSVKPAAPATPTPGRNAPCICGSGQKWKKCCGAPKPVAAAL